MNVKSAIFERLVQVYLAILKDHVLEGVWVSRDDMCLLLLIVAFDL